jgi:hypothetical protein
VTLVVRDAGQADRPGPGTTSSAAWSGRNRSTGVGARSLGEAGINRAPRDSARPALPRQAAGPEGHVGNHRLRRRCPRISAANRDSGWRDRTTTAAK